MFVVPERKGSSDARSGGAEKEVVAMDWAGLSAIDNMGNGVVNRLTSRLVYDAENDADISWRMAGQMEHGPMWGMEDCWGVSSGVSNRQPNLQARQWQGSHGQ